MQRANNNDPPERASVMDELRIESARLPDAEVPSSSRTVLVVESTSDDLLMLYDLLADAGYHVATFSNPLDALDWAGRTRPAVMIADAHLPEMSGLELLTRIRKASASTRVVLTSSDLSRPAYKEVIAAGGETLIHKPFDLTALLSAVERAWNSVRGRRS